MSLTKKDLDQIAGLINSGFKDLMMPYIDAKLDGFRDEMDERFKKIDQSFEKIDQRFEKMDDKMDKQFFTLHGMIEDNTKLIGGYVKDFVDGHQVLVKRVGRLEKVCAA